MNVNKRYILLIVIFLTIFISGVVSDMSANMGICAIHTTCATNLIFKYGRPIIYLFSVIILFTTPLVLFSDRFVNYWIPRILWSLLLPIFITFISPTYCGGFLGCLFEREQIARAVGILWAGILAICMVIKGIRDNAKRKKGSL